ncbi:MAG: PAS domain-containing protein [Fibrobacter sp.]|nr:PAS domain-containing protein [Fibrobacter sp.]
MYKDIKDSANETSCEQIQLSKAELELIFDVAPECICVVNRDHRLLRVNKSYASFAGKSIKELLGTSCYRCFWGQEKPCEDCPVERAFNTGEAEFRKKAVLRGKNDIRYFETCAFPVCGESDEIVRVIEYNKDITDEKRVFEQLVRSEKLASIGIMTAGIAHEMNNPLSGISGTAVNLLRMPEKYGLNEKGISRVTAILESAARATNIMKDLLHLSRKQDSSNTLVDINSLLVKTVNAIHLGGAADVRRKFDLDDSVRLISCDPSKIEQVILNITTNCMQSVLEKHALCMAEGKEYTGIIEVMSVLEDDNVLITFTDNGIGIPEENRSKIFDPFFSTRSAGQGTGLGLSICLKIIGEHGGRIYFECYEESTVFSIVLPRERKSQPVNKIRL